MLFYKSIVWMSVVASSAVVHAQDADALPERGDPLWLTFLQATLFLYLILIGVSIIHKDTTKKSRQNCLFAGCIGMALTIVMALI